MDEQPDLSTIGGRLQWARTRKGFTSPRKAALALRWNQNTYKAHEQGLRGAEGLKTDTARKYAKGFGVSVHWLLTGTGAALADSETARAWEDMTEEQRRLALRLVEVTEGRGPLIESMPEEEIPQDELPAHFSRKKASAPDVPNVERLRQPRKT